ncbi:MAG: hypothetical protein LBD28_04940 [Tannerellaceae bacterium]|jgi:hypothetical protein|nr:hypothetical protein [Tannerellaceae bacterium]
MNKNILNDKIAKLLLLCAALIFAIGCYDYPIDEDGLMITERAECYVSNFDLLGADFYTVRTKVPDIDTLACTINIEVKYGVDMKNLWPQFTLVTDAKLDPKITGFTDFSDLANPKQYTVVSGNRKVRKTYTVYVSIQKP